MFLFKKLAVKINEIKNVAKYILLLCHLISEPLFNNQ